MKQFILRSIAAVMALSMLAACDTTSSEPSTVRTTERMTTMSTTEPVQSKVLPKDYDIENLTYELVFAEEFDQDGPLNPEHWGYEMGGGGWGNNELQYYTIPSDEAEPNAWVEDGKLIIEARQEKKGIRDYTSARIVSRGKQEFLYGKFEFSAKLPEGRGTWPAIWMMPSESKYGSWPRSGEIDIMEHVGYDQDNIVGTIHTMAYNHGIRTQKGKTVHTEGVSEEFHTYTMEWLPDQIRWFVDGELYNTFKPDDYTDIITNDEWPFDQKFFLIFNIAVGGNWGGAKGVDESIWPQRMEIEYARVYQAKEINDLITE